MEQKDYERIAALETQLETLTKSMDRIETKLDLLTTNFITRNEADVRFSNINHELKNVKEELKETKENKKANNALLVSATSVALTFIFGLINLLMKLKG
ncbi:hypothetical protein [Bacillus smithii]|uniref:hypothetical protein n=1 Tax=Bacillus smithii TaxID=1479 RepID=UPI0030C9D792